MRVFGDPRHVDIVVPQVVQGLTTKRLLVMSFEEGYDLNNKVSVVNTCGSDLERTISMISRAFSHQIFVDGIFHSDPHPGNLLVSASKHPDVEGAFWHRPVLLDFGLTRKIDEKVRKAWAKIIVGCAHTKFDLIKQGFHEVDFIPLPDSTDSVDKQMVYAAKSIFPMHLTRARRTKKDRMNTIQILARHGLMGKDVCFVLRVLGILYDLYEHFEFETSVMRRTIFTISEFAEM